MARILVVEDNTDLAFALSNSLEIAGYEVIVAPDGVTGLKAAKRIEPDLIVLDLSLPGLDGYRVLKSLRAEGFVMPVLILTAKTEEADKVLGFRLGADDYVTKPFGVLELLARIEVRLRRTDPGASAATTQGDPTVRFGEIVVDPARRTVLRRGEVVSLTPREFDLLMALVHKGGRVATRHALLKAVWDYQEDVQTRTVDSHIAELRRKLEDDPSRPRYLITVWKAGYKLAV